MKMKIPLRLPESEEFHRFDFLILQMHLAATELQGEPKLQMLHKVSMQRFPFHFLN